MLWFLLFGSFAQMLTGAMALWQHGDAHYLEVVASHVRFPVLFAFLGAASVWRGNRVLGALTIVYAGAIVSASAGLVAAFTAAMCGGFWVQVILWLRGKPGWHALAQAAVWTLLGFVVFDLAFDAAYVFFGAQQELSLLNNTVHVGKLVHTVWLPICFVGAALGVGYGVYNDRTVYDYVLAALFLGGAALLFLLIEPKELAVVAGETQHLLTVGISHVVSFVAIIAALVCLRLKGDHLGRAKR